MTIGNFILACARSVKDRNFNVISKQDWLEILTFNINSLQPDIMFTGTVTKTIATDLTELQYNLTVEDIYSRIQKIKQIIIIDSAGRQAPYDFWSYNPNTGVIDFNPDSAKSTDLVFEDYTTVKIIWEGSAPDFSASSTSTEIAGLKANHFILLRDICIMEALNRIVIDQTKLDRYRTLQPTMNEFTVLQIINRMTTSIELAKRRLGNGLSVHTF